MAAMKYRDSAGVVHYLGAGGEPTFENSVSGTVFRVIYSTSWPARPTSRTDVYVDWVGGTTQPPGMLAGDTWTPEV